MTIRPLLFVLLLLTLFAPGRGGAEMAYPTTAMVPMTPVYMHPVDAWWQYYPNRSVGWDYFSPVQVSNQAVPMVVPQGMVFSPPPAIFLTPMPPPMVMAQAPQPPASDENTTLRLDRGGMTTGQQAIYLGSFLKQDNVELVLKRIRDIGVPAFTTSEVIKGKTFLRLYAGPFANRQAADEALAKLKASSSLIKGKVELSGVIVPYPVH